MSTGRHRLQLSARQKIAALVVAVAVVAGIPLVALVGNSSTPAQAAAMSYDNAAIADKALSYIGKPLGQACRDARTADKPDGECRSFVNCIISMVSGGKQRTGTGWPDYFVGFANAGQRIYDVNALSKGDVVQQGGNERARLHTYIIVGRVSGNVYNVVDSNSDRQHVVQGGPGHNRSVVLGDQVRAYRFGTVRGATTPPRQQPPVQQPVQPSSRPTFPVMNTSEQPPDGVWFRDNPNAAGPRLNGYGVYAGDRVRLECFGWGQAIGARANRLWYRATNLTRPNAPGRANVGWLNAHYVNDNQVSNAVTPGVPAC